MIEVLIEEDLDWLMAITEQFNSEHYDVPLNLERSREFIAQVLASPYSIGFRSDTGYIIGAIETDPMRDWVLLKEYAWYSTGSDGVRLLKAFQQHGLDCGVDEVRMCSMGRNHRVEKLLTRLGYVELETNFTMRV